MGTKQQILDTISEAQKVKFVSADIMYVCAAWNKYAPIKHSVFSRAMQAMIHEVLKDYEAEDIVKAIMKYGKVLSEPNKYWWTAGGYVLQTFLTKDNGSILTRFIDYPLAEFTKNEGIASASSLLPKI